MALPDFNDVVNPYPPGPNCTSVWGCVGKGDTCSHSLVGLSCNGQQPFSNQSCCALGLSCIGGVCAVDNSGSLCGGTYNNASSCMTNYAGATIQCVGSNSTTAGTCQYMYGVGDTCTSSANCLYNLNCSGTCQGIATTNACNLTQQCVYGDYCALNFTCQPMVASGGTCGGLVPCTAGTVCLTVNGTSTCVGLFTQTAGTKPCMSSTGGSTCNTGLVCWALNSTCVTADTDITSCDDGNATTSCPISTWSCACSPFSGKSYCNDPYYNDCTDQQSSLLTCQTSSSCPTVSGAPNSCIYQNCYSEWKKSQSCGCTSASTGLDSCSYNDFCGGFPVWAIIVIIVVAIILVLGIVLLVFFMMRRRRQYDSI